MPKAYVCDRCGKLSTKLNSDGVPEEGIIFSNLEKIKERYNLISPAGKFYCCRDCAKEYYTWRDKWLLMAVPLKEERMTEMET